MHARLVVVAVVGVDVDCPALQGSRARMHDVSPRNARRIRHQFLAIRHTSVILQHAPPVCGFPKLNSPTWRITAIEAMKCDGALTPNASASRNTQCFDKSIAHV